MAKTKLKKPRKITANNNNNNNIEDLKKSLENGGLYQHSSPPKLVESSSGVTKIREYIRAGEVEKLEELLLAGHGYSLVNQPSTDKTVRNFLKTVPAYMAKIDLVHDAVDRGNLRDLKALLDRRKLSRSRDAQGMGLLHKAVLNGNKEIVDYLLYEYPESSKIVDNEGRTPLHYCAASKKPEEMFNFMSEKVMETQYRDDRGKPASYYMSNPYELHIPRRESPKNGSNTQRRKPVSKKNSPLHKLKTPPKREGLNITGANIRIWIHDQDLPKLEQIVWDGQGHRLLNETSNNPKVRQFLHLVPRLMTKIKEIHQAAISGDLETMEAKADQPEILLAKDHNGLNPLHRAAALGHRDICEWIVGKNSVALYGTDRKGRIPLHYSTIPTDGGNIFDYFVKHGADPMQEDQFNKSAEYYRGRPGEIDLRIVYEPPTAPRIGGLLASDYPPSKMPSRNNSGGRQKSQDTVVSKNSRNSNNVIEKMRKANAIETPRRIGDRGRKTRSMDSDDTRKTRSTGSDDTVDEVSNPVTTGERKKKKITKSEHFLNLYNKGRKDFTGKRKYVDMRDVTEKQIDKLIQDGDVGKLEYVVLSGRGGALDGKTSWNDNVRRFLKKVPTYVEKIELLQIYASEGDLDMVRTLTRENSKFAMGRNKDGAIALHFAAGSGNKEVVKHLLDIYPEGMFVEDKERRVPVHWAALSKKVEGSKDIFDFLENKGSYIYACDIHGRSADDYLKDQGLLPYALTPVSSRRSSKNSLQEGLETPRSRSRSRNRNTSRSPAKSDGQRSRNASKSPVKSDGQRSRNASKSPAKSEGQRSRNPSKSPARSEGQKSRNASKSPTGNEEEGTPDTSERRSRSRTKKSSQTTPVPSKSRSPSKTNSKSPGRDKSKSPAKSPARNKSKSPSRSKSKSPSKSKSNSPTKDKSKSPQKEKTKKKTKKTKDPKLVAPARDVEVEKAILDAENENYQGISRLILRGDGYRMIGAKSNSDEVQMFLDELPDSLKSINDIQQSVAAGDLRKTMNLLDRKEKAYVRDANQSNLLHTAVINGHTDIVRYILPTFPDLVNQQDVKGRTPLHYAALLRDGGHIMKILKLGNGDPYIKDNAGRSADDYFDNPDLSERQLISELSAGKLVKEEEIIALNEQQKQQYESGNLLAVPGADDEDNEDEEDDEEADDEGTEDENTENDDEDKADKDDKEDNDDKENNYGDDEEVFDDSFREKNKKADGDFKDIEEEIEAAIIAAENGEYEPLSAIVRRGDGKYLIGKKSSDYDVQGYLDKIPEILESIKELFVAVEEGETRTVGSLLDRKDKAKVKTNHGASLLHVAVINGHSDTTRYLVQNFPSSLTEEDDDKRTALHYAAVVRDGGHLYKILKRADADSTVKDKFGHTPEDYLNDSELLSQMEIMKALKEESSTGRRPITKDSVASYYGSAEEGMELADENTLEELDEVYSKLADTESDSLLKKYLTQDVYDSLKHRVTESGATLLDVIKSGVENPDSNIGVYAPDAESYVMFKELFDPIIEEYHLGFDESEVHPAKEYGDPDVLGDLNEDGDYVISTRIRCARSLEGYPFNSKMTVDHYKELEQDVENALDSLDGDLAGYYTPLATMKPEIAEKLTEEHLMFKQDDRFLEAAGAFHFWPTGRGIFLNSDDTCIVWVNEEDHMRIISMEKGGSVKSVYDRFVKALSVLEDRLPFSTSPRLGNLTFCPTNLGTGIRASVHIRLPNLGQDNEKLEEIAAKYSLQVRGTSGEHSEVQDYVFDISNKRRLGLTEIEIIQEMYEGIKEIIRLEIESNTEDEDDGNEY